jgi:hypothetical protein
MTDLINKTNFKNLKYIIVNNNFTPLCHYPASKNNTIGYFPGDTSDLENGAEIKNFISKDSAIEAAKKIALTYTGYDIFVFGVEDIARIFLTADVEEN